MINPVPLLQAADTVLSPLLRTKLMSMCLARAPDALRAFNGKGVTIDPPDEPDGSPGDFDMHTAEAERTRARIDVKSVLQEALGPQGLTVGEETRDKKFLRLTGTSIPAGCECYFLMDNQVPPYAIRALSKAPVCIVLHVNTEITADYNSLLAHGIGVHVLRLKDAEQLNSEALRKELEVVVKLQTVTRAGGIDLGSGIEGLAESAKIAEPAHIIEYAATRQDALFEGATAQILNPLSEGLIVLGGRFSGKPVPDGMIIDGYRSKKPTAALYDCKSRKEDLYELDPGDADQQRRYLEILNALIEQDQWSAHGIVLFTPEVDKDQFYRKTIKSPWTSFAGAEGRIIIIQAKWLLKWHLLTQAESPFSFGLLFNCQNFWEAVMRQKLPGGLTDPQLSFFFGDRAQKIRLMSDAECELCWLAGLAASGGKPKIGELAEAIAGTDPGNIKTTSITRANIIVKFYQALDVSNTTVPLIASTMSISGNAVRYLALCKSFQPDGFELTDRAYSNFRRLHSELQSIGTN